MAMFWVVYHRHHEMQFKTPITAGLKSETQGDIMLEGLQETRRVLRENLLKPQQKQTKYAHGKQININVGDGICRWTRNLRPNRNLKRLDDKRARPYTVNYTINRFAYKLDLPKIMRHLNVFHMGVLNRYTDWTIGQPSSEPHPVIVHNCKGWDVNQILDSKRSHGK
jgi:hypothetical protein